ncbi:hypothetical protein FGG36_gp11 [Mycobacterium phage Jeffabunny]|uniref:Uncharacterized protein n=8 Tax=Gladiatorvirus TaxID=2948726 RepID=V5R4Q9_9CAUD|nr:hypothetical protein X820_gp010 [Mycobacterium phage CloudWang3]YP_008858528.1 hypothetical protein X828_gp010 [Mycobacterium phage Artemis2UCLA]YP_008859210.1 hypothetical protein X821_gp010 [Mycobacterium phage Zaka]YP_009224224.1 hypothetical protein AXJ19_gp010 [Mycobacterium phage VohminGhazi]YP_009637903.1 hypothetical protein FGG32_gp010 [Mycobacterium phage EricB]YP_009638264.1 hypothetical protein FGG36_gp11 [Mycobacterium phage Jeffabunny]YP_010061226.1 hypothetical protein KIP54
MNNTERKIYIAGIGWVYCRGNSYYRR